MKLEFTGRITHIERIEYSKRVFHITDNQGKLSTFPVKCQDDVEVGSACSVYEHSGRRTVKVFRPNGDEKTYSPL